MTTIMPNKGDNDSEHKTPAFTCFRFCAHLSNVKILGLGRFARETDALRLPFQSSDAFRSASNSLPYFADCTRLQL